MKRILVSICLMACLALSMSSCKKDLYSDTQGDEEILVNETAVKINRCVTDRRMQSVYQGRPAYRTEILEGRFQQMEQYEKNTGRSAAELPLFTIPVHVIVVHQPGHGVGSQTNIGEQRIRSQIAALNADFLRQNQDASRTPSEFEVSGGQIQFCLASRDPSGAATDGITRYASNQNFDNNELSIKRNTNWDPQRYLNIWVVPDIEGLGYAYLPTPSSLPHPDEDGVVVITEAFGGPGSGAAAPFNLGRTLTHEVGHYLGLDHIWGDGCQVDDGITDTPRQAEENYECPNHPSPSCNNQGDMFMNYMDYTDDHCMNAFSTGQNLYMRSILTSSRAQLITPGRTDCPTDTTGTGGPNSTCNDGIKNGDETGIDCGGSCVPCQSSGSVDAGITRVDYEILSGDCSQAIRLTATIRNFGNATLKSVIIDVRTGSTKLTSFPWSGSLAANSSLHVELPSFSLAGGNHSIAVSTQNPNGTADTNPSNNSKSIHVNVSGNSSYTLVIKPDDYGADISWKIKNGSGKVVATGGGYPDFDRTVIKESFCLSDDCYTLIMLDAYGDGLCCDYGRGWYELRNQTGQVLLDSDGYYGYRETQSFCIDGSNNLSRLQVDRTAKAANLPARISSRRPIRSDTE